MRLFVSIELPVEVRGELYNRVPDLEAWKKTPADQIHLTLFFIGDCTQEEREKIISRLAGITAESFEIELTNLGVFPDYKNASVLWNGVKESAQLLSLQKRISEALKQYRKKPDRKKFVPHITLARRKSTTTKNDDMLQKLLHREYAKTVIQIYSFTLKYSILKPSGSEHFTLKEFNLKNQHQRN